MKQKKQIYSWVLYDWANSAFATTILAAVLPIFYENVAAAGLPETLATSYWGYTQTIAMIIVALLAPILGAISDHSRAPRSFLKFFAGLGILSTAFLFFVNQGNYLLASLLFIVANVGFSGGNVFYDSFLPVIAGDKRIDSISSFGFAAGYLGGGILLAVNLAMISKPGWFGIANRLLATKLCFLSVALWWFIFSLPAFTFLPQNEPRESRMSLKEYAREGFNRIRTTFYNIRKYQELFKFLIAFWLYNDGIGTIIRMATIYGRELGIERSDLMGALLLTQLVGVPFSLLFGKLGEWIGAKQGIYLALVVYLGITIKGYFLTTAFDFWLLAGMVGMVQGGAQALSRSLYGSMIPQQKSAEFYGFFGVSSKFAAIMGPFVFAFIGQVTGSSRWGIISVALFFILGILILTTVDVDKGRREARAN